MCYFIFLNSAFLILFILSGSAVANPVASPKAVIMIHGASRSGKSSLCCAIDAHKGWRSVGSLYGSYCLATCAELFPEQCSCIKIGIEESNIRHALASNFCIFKKDVSPETQDSIRLAIKQIQDYFADARVYAEHKSQFSFFALQEIDTHLNNNMNVLADVSWYVTAEQIQALYPDTRIARALLYCSLPVIIERLITNNARARSTGSAVNYRFFIEPLASFASLYELTSSAPFISCQAPVDTAIDMITRSELLAALAAVEPYLPEQSAGHGFSGFMMYEFTRADLREYKEALLQKCGEQEMLYVVPKKQYDIVIHTNNCSPEECAQLLIKHMQS